MCQNSDYKQICDFNYSICLCIWECLLGQCSGLELLYLLWISSDAKWRFIAKVMLLLQNIFCCEQLVGWFGVCWTDSVKDAHNLHEIPKTWCSWKLLMSRGSTKLLSRALENFKSRLQKILKSLLRMSIDWCPNLSDSKPNSAKWNIGTWFTTSSPRIWGEVGADFMDVYVCCGWHHCNRGFVLSTCNILRSGYRTSFHHHQSDPTGYKC